MTGARLGSASCAWNKRICFVEGDFAIENKRIDGTFRIGATGDVLKAIPRAPKVLPNHAAVIFGPR